MNSLENYKNHLISHEAEKSILGAMFIDPSVPEKAIDSLSVDMFDNKFNREIFSICFQIANKNEAIDYVSVVNELEKQKVEYRREDLFDMGNFVPSSANVEYYIKVVREKFKLRKLIELCDATVQNVNDGYEYINDIISKLSLDLSLLEHEDKKSMLSMSENVSNAIQVLHEKYEGKIEVISTGYYKLDRAIYSFQLDKGRLITLAGASSMGKSTFAMNLARNVSKNHDVAYFTAEMGADNFTNKLISLEGRIDSKVLEDVELLKKADEQTWLKISNATQSVEKLKLHIDDDTDVTPNKVLRKLRILKREKNIKVAFIDYLQLMEADNSRLSLRESINEITRKLKKGAGELGIDIVLLSQLKRIDGEKRRPILTDLKESGNIENDSDVVIFVHRPEYYGVEFDKNGAPTKNIAEIIIAKQRYGQKDTFLHMRCDLEFSSFQAVDLYTHGNSSDGNVRDAI